jgi:hypothetical protein
LEERLLEFVATVPLDVWEIAFWRYWVADNSAIAAFVSGYRFRVDYCAAVDSRRVSIGSVRDETAVFLSCAFNSRNSLQYLQFGSAQYNSANGDESVIRPPLNGFCRLLLAAENTKIVQSIVPKHEIICCSSYAVNLSGVTYSVAKKIHSFWQVKEASARRKVRRRKRARSWMRLSLSLTLLEPHNSFLSLVAEC